MGLPAVELPFSGDLPGLSGNREVTVYRWRTDAGSWEYGQAPPEGIPFEEVTVDPDANLLPALESSGENSEPEETGSASSLEMAAPGDYLDQAREVKRALADRNRRQQEAIERQ